MCKPYDIENVGQIQFTKTGMNDFHLCEPCNYDICQLNPNYRKPIPFDENCNCCKHNHNPNQPNDITVKQ